MNEKELFKQAQRDVVEICRLKAKLIKMQKQKEAISEAFRKWRENHGRNRKNKS